MSTYPHFGTNAIHVGQDPEQWNCKALVPPIFTTTTYKQDEPGKPVRIIVTYCSLHSLCFSFCLSLFLSLPQPMHDYIREGSPTRTALEKSVAACEGAQYGMCTCTLDMLDNGEWVCSSMMSIPFMVTNS